MVTAPDVAACRYWKQRFPNFSSVVLVVIRFVAVSACRLLFLSYGSLTFFFSWYTHFSICYVSQDRCGCCVKLVICYAVMLCLSLDEARLDPSRLYCVIMCDSLLTLVWQCSPLLYSSIILVYITYLSLVHKSDNVLGRVFTVDSRPYFGTFRVVVSLVVWHSCYMAVTSQIVLQVALVRVQVGTQRMNL